MMKTDTTLLIEMALDLANSINNEDRFDRLLTSIRKLVRCDAVVLLGLHEDILTPLAIQGLSSEVQGRRFKLAEHQRLATLCQQTQPYIFPDNCDLPDPYDGLLLSQEGNLPVHSCMGMPLYSDNKLIGLITLDSLDDNAFTAINLKTLTLAAALSAATLKTALEFEKLQLSSQQATALIQELTQEALLKDGGEIIGQSQCIHALKKDIGLVANSDYAVLITGETGVGKELVARKIHQLSARSERPLVQINCASLPESLVEAELFGHTKGAFTGADSARAGKFQLANGGSVFLDEVGELPLATQSKLLRVLQSGEIQPIGKDAVEIVDVRIIAATNRDLMAEVKTGRFRADLYHRLAVYPLWVPPLAQRGKDILLLSGHFLERTSRRLGIRQLKLDNEVEQVLLQYDWPGNIRELEHVISRASLKARARSQPNEIIALTVRDFDLNFENSPYSTVLNQQSANVKPQSLNVATQAFQRQQIQHALQQAKGNWSEASRLLEIDRSNLVRLAKRLGIQIEKTIGVRS